MAAATSGAVGSRKTQGDRRARLRAAGVAEEDARPAARPDRPRPRRAGSGRDGPRDPGRDRRRAPWRNRRADAGAGGRSVGRWADGGHRADCRGPGGCPGWRTGRRSVSRSDAGTCLTSDREPGVVPTMPLGPPLRHLQQGGPREAPRAPGPAGAPPPLRHLQQGGPGPDLGGLEVVESACWLRPGQRTASVASATGWRGFARRGSVAPGTTAGGRRPAPIAR